MIAMATVIAVYNSSGCIGRCDAKCHDAQGPDCDCICGGANHGGGLKAAIQNNQDHWDAIAGNAQEWAKGQPTELGPIVVERPPVQAPLFDL